MLQVIVFTLVGILFVLAALEVIVRACVTTEKRDWRRCIVISAPVQTIRNKIRGMKTLKEEVSEHETNKQTDTQVATV